MDVGFVYEQMLHKWTKSLYSLLLFPMLCKSFCRSKKAKQIIKRENFPAIGSTWKKKKTPSSKDLQEASSLPATLLGNNINEAAY